MLGMLCNLACCVVVALTSMTARHQCALGHVPHPVLTFDRLSDDAGEQWMGDPARFEFKLHNSGDAPLELDARPGCGCTVVEFQKRIPVGGDAYLRAELRTTGYHGKVAKSIEVTSNDPALPRVTLDITVTIRPVVAFSGPNVIALREDGSTHAQFDVRVADKEPAEISRVLCSAKDVTLSYEQVSKAGLETRYRLSLVIGAGAAYGKSSFALTVATNSKREPASILQVKCEKGIMVSPSGVFLGTLDRNSKLPVTQEITVKREGLPFKITGIDSDDANLQIHQEQLSEGQGYRIRFSYSGGWTKGFIARTLTIHTDDPKQPTLKVTVAAQVNE